MSLKLSWLVCKGSNESSQGLFSKLPPNMQFLFFCLPPLHTLRMLSIAKSSFIVGGTLGRVSQNVDTTKKDAWEYQSSAFIRALTKDLSWKHSLRWLLTCGLMCKLNNQRNLRQGRGNNVSYFSIVPLWCGFSALQRPLIKRKSKRIWHYFPIVPIQGKKTNIILVSPNWTITFDSLKWQKAALPNSSASNTRKLFRTLLVWKKNCGLNCSSKLAISKSLAQSLEQFHQFQLQFHWQILYVMNWSPIQITLLELVQ